MNSCQLATGSEDTARFQFKKRLARVANRISATASSSSEIAAYLVE
jgi:hypothetical protein